MDLVEQLMRTEYIKGASKLPFEYQRARAAGLSYSVAKRIEFCACGHGAVVNHLIEQAFKTPEQVDEYVTSLGCMKETSEATMNALAEVLDV